MTESLKDLFGTPEPPPMAKLVAKPVGPPVVIEAPKPDIKEQRQAILKNRSMKASDKIKVLRALGKR